MRKVMLGIFLIATLSLNSQNIDSLKNIILHSTGYKSKIDALNSLGWELRFSNPDTTIQLLSSSITLSYANNYTKGLAQALNNYGCSVMLYGMFDAAADSLNKAFNLYLKIGDSTEAGKTLVNKAINYYYQAKADSAISEARKALTYLKNDTPRLAATYLNIGLFYRTAGNFKQAISSYLKALSLYKYLNKSSLVASTQNNIATLFYFLKKYDKTIEYSNYAYKYATKAGNNREIASSFFEKGIAYDKIGEKDSAELYLLKAHKILKKLPYEKDLNATAFNLANVYMAKGKLDNAFEIYDTLKDRFKAKNDIKGYTSCINGLGLIYYAKGKNDSALKYLEQSYQQLSYIEDPFIFKSVLKSLADLYERLGNDKKALELHKTYENLKDSLYKEEIARQTAEIEAKYRLRELISGMMDISREKEKIAGKNKLLFISVLLAIGLLSVLFYFYRKKMKLVKEMNKQKEKYLNEYKSVKEAYEQVHNKLEKISYLMSESQKIKSEDDKEYPIESLTKRELEVLTYISIGLLDKEIADKLNISVTTVRTHCRNIYKKLGINNRTEAAKIASKYKL